MHLKAGATSIRPIHRRQTHHHTGKTQRESIAKNALILLAANQRRTMSTRPPLPPFTHETAVRKVRLAEDGWNSRDPEKSRSGLHAKLPVEKLFGIRERQARNRGVSSPQMGEGTGLQTDQRALGFHWQSYRSALCLRVAR